MLLVGNIMQHISVDIQEKRLKNTGKCVKIMTIAVRTFNPTIHRWIWTVVGRLSDADKLRKTMASREKKQDEEE